MQKCPVYQLEAAWKYIASPCKFPPTPEEISKNVWLRQWSPVTFKEVVKRTYHRYNPCLLETGTKLYYVLCFDPTTFLYKNIGIHNWIALPPLNFLPSGCDRVIAGSAGNSWAILLRFSWDEFLMPFSLSIRHFVSNNGYWFSTRHCNVGLIKRYWVEAFAWEVVLLIESCNLLHAME